MGLPKKKRRKADIVDGDFNGDDKAGLVSGSGIVILAKSHDINTLRTKGGTDGRSRSSFAGVEGELNDPDDCEEK